MNLGAESKLYFIAAALFVLAAAIGWYDEGIELKTGLGLVMAGAMVALGLKARKDSNA